MKESQPQTKHDGTEQIEEVTEERKREQMEVEPEDGKEGDYRSQHSEKSQLSEKDLQVV